MRTSPGIFVALGMLALGSSIWFLVTHHQHVSFSLKHLEGKDSLIPVAIIGSGPAGLSAALYSIRLGFHTVVFEGPKPGGQLTETGIVENWPGIGKQEGPQIMSTMRTYVSSLGALIAPETIAQLDLSSWPYRLITDEGVILNALSIIVATGAAPRVLGIPGERDYWGKGVTTCALCDAPFYKDKDVVVVGGGDGAFEQALQLAPHARTVTILIRRATIRASQALQNQVRACVNVRIDFNQEITQIHGNGNRVTDITIRDNTTHTTATRHIDGVFLAIGHEPRTAIVTDKVRLRSDGTIAVIGRTQQTSVPGIFAAGDVEDQHYRQAGVAAGNGIKAAIEAAQFLNNCGWHATLAKRLNPYFYQLADTTPSPVKHIISYEQFQQEVLGAHQTAIIDFYAEHCPSCMHMLPLYEAVARRFASQLLFFKVDTDKVPALEKHLKIDRIPCFIVFRDRQQIARYYAIMNKPEMSTFVERFVHM